MEARDREPRSKTDALWRLRRALGQNHKLYPSVYRFDVLDLTEAEIQQLAVLAETATCASDLVVVAEVVGRLRLDGDVMETATFEALVLRGEIGANLINRTFYARERTLSRPSCVSLSHRKSRSTYSQPVRASDRVSSERLALSLYAAPAKSPPWQANPVRNT